MEQAVRSTRRRPPGLVPTFAPLCSQEVHIGLGDGPKRIPRLLDAGGLRASSSPGYKIPITEAAIGQLVGHGDSIIGPLFAHLHTARGELLRTEPVNGELDILGGPSLAYLTEMRRRGENATHVGWTTSCNARPPARAICGLDSLFGVVSRTLGARSTLVAGPAASRTLRSLRSLRVGSRLARYRTCLDRTQPLGGRRQRRKQVGLDRDEG